MQALLCRYRPLSLRRLRSRLTLKNPRQGERRVKPIPKPLTMPWAISEEGRQLLLAVWSRGDLYASVQEQALAARDGKPLENTRTVTERNGVAIVPVDGPLFRKADMLTEISGATTYERLRKDLQAAVDNTRIRGILLQVNSPGGEADGCNELAQVYSRVLRQETNLVITSAGWVHQARCG